MNTKYNNEDELSSVVINPETLTKKKKSPKEIFILMRPWIFVFIFLIISEIFLRFSIPAWMISNKRIQNCQTYYEFLQVLGARHNISHFSLYLEIIEEKDPKSFKIYFLGDSIVLGNAPFKLYSDDERDDVALSLEKELQFRLSNKNIKVYNLASLGAGEYANYEMIQVLVKFKPDFIIKNVNFRNFNDFIIDHIPTDKVEKKQIVQISEKKQNVRQKIQKNIFLNKLNSFIALWNSFFRKSIQEKARLIGESVESILYKYSMLYQSRDYLSFLIFNEPKNKKLERISLVFKKYKPSNNQMNRVVNIVEDIKEIKTLIKINYNFPRLNVINRSLIFSRNIVDFLSSKKIPNFFFMSPINHKLVDPLIENKDIFIINVELIDSIFTGDDIYFSNFNDALNEDSFRDSDHLNAKGNQDLARLILEEIRPIIEKLLNERKA